MNKRIIPSIILFIFAGLLAAYAVWAFSNSAKVIDEAVAAGQITIWGNLYDVISFYMANCAQYFVYALLLFASGLILQMRRRVVKNQVDSANILQSDNADEGFDDWFEKVDSSKEKAED